MDHKSGACYAYLGGQWTSLSSTYVGAQAKRYSLREVDEILEGLPEDATLADVKERLRIAFIEEHLVKENTPAHDGLLEWDNTTLDYINRANDFKIG